jgi:RimJ/RimL family protein N-acetyltransferase
MHAFRTERLTAERLRPEHFPDYARLFQDARVMATLSTDGLPLPDGEVADWLRSSLQHWDRHGYGVWIFREEGRFIGRAGLGNCEVGGRPEVELGFALLPEFWGRGLATEMARSMLRLAFERIGLRHVVGFTTAANRASRRVMEKAGFRFEGEAVQADLPHVFYRATAPAFAPGDFA